MLFYSPKKLAAIISPIVGGLVIIGLIVVVVVIVCRQRAITEKKTLETAARLIGLDELVCKTINQFLFNFYIFLFALNYLNLSLKKNHLKMFNLVTSIF